MRSVTWICALGGLAFAAACGSSTSGTTGGAGGTGGTTSSSTTSGTTTTTGTTSTTSGTGGTSSTTSTSGTGGSAPACSGSTPVALTVKNYDNWCSITVNGSVASSGAEETVCVADGSIPVTAAPLSGFQLGDWHGTAGDTGSGDPGTVANGTSTASVTVTGSAAVCVWVCCPFTGGSGCPTTDQCP